MCNYIPSHRPTIKYRIVMNSSPGYYSILDLFDQRSEDSKLILKEFDEKKNIYVVDHESQKCCTVYAMLG